MNIKKIILLSDDMRVPSGVGVQSRYIATELVKRGYEIVQVGGAISHESFDVKTVDGVKIYPVNGYGNPHFLRNLITQEQPDALLIFTDPRFGIWLWQIEDEIRTMMPIFYYHLGDDTPVPRYNQTYYESCDSINCISKLSTHIVYDTFKNNKEYELIMSDRAKQVIEDYKHDNK